MTIAVTSNDPGMTFRLDGAIKNFLIDESPSDVEVGAAWGDLSSETIEPVRETLGQVPDNSSPSPSPPRGGRIPPRPKRERVGVRVHKSTRGDQIFDSGALWQLYHQNGVYRFSFTSPALGCFPYKVASFNNDFTRGEVLLNRSVFNPDQPVYPVPQNAPYVNAGMNPVPTPPSENGAFSIQKGWNGVNVLNVPEGRGPKATDPSARAQAGVSPRYGVYPLQYPLDELLIINLLARGKGVEVHACGVIDALGNGHLLVGQSGAGKTTMARLWQPVLGRAKGKEDEVTILSDDRIILRKDGNRLWMYGTPWHGDAGFSCSARAPLKQIYLLHRGQKNELVPIGGAAAAARLFACSFPPFYSRAGLDFTLAFFDEVVRTVPCQELRFVPDGNVVKFILEHSAISY